MQIRDIPRLKQINGRACGPAALQMVSNYFGKQVSQQEIIRGIGGLKKYGARTIQLATFAEKQGLRVECFSYNRKLARGLARVKKPSRINILRFLKRKIPVILAVRQFLLDKEHRLPKTNEGHFIVITGRTNDVYQYIDPEDGKQHKIKEDDLLFAWHNNILDSSAYLLVVWK